MSIKLCSGPCGRKLTVSPEHFQRDARRASGFRARCKKCSNVAATKDTAVEVPSRETARSVHYDANGNIISSWVKTDKKLVSYDAMVEACKAIADGWTHKAKPVKEPKTLNKDLLSAYCIGDAHIGMLAWPAETGNKFNLEIAEGHLCGAADKLVELSPASESALVVNLGDWYHADSFRNETTKGTRVDVDGRWPKVLATGVRIMRRIIDRALEKHKHVTVINEIGNHDTNSSIMLAICLAQFYEKEPRVTIDTSPEPFHYYRFGKVLIGVTHGDRTKKNDLGPIMANDRPVDWGETKHRYWLLGHVHHDVVKEGIGVTMESFRTLAGKDAWHHGQGYRAGRDMKMDVYHKEFGKISRSIVGVDQLDFE